MRTLSEKYRQFFSLFQKAPGESYDKRPYGHVYFMGIDAEWYESGGRNVVISYQMATVSSESANNIIKYTPGGKRLRLAELVELGVRSLDPATEVVDFGSRDVTQLANTRSLPPFNPGEKTLVILVAHNVGAEWSVLADRDEPHVTKRLALVRKSPITDGHAIKLHMSDGRPVDLKIFDTMLLAPATHRSLKKLSALLGKKDELKEEISQHYIQNMHLYLAEKPKEFERYALRDSEACLKLFFLLQNSLNKLVYGEEAEPIKLFRTLASAGVEGYLSKLITEEIVDEAGEVKTVQYSVKKDFKKYIETLRGGTFHSAYQLVKRAYHGGRNEGYFVGRTSRHAETRDKVWVDIDFSGCYPTAMALCPKIDVEGNILRIPLCYRITEAKARALLKSIPDEIVRGARDGLDASIDEFETYLASLKSKRVAKIIREKARVSNNRHLNRWLKMDQERKERYLIPGFAAVSFSFPKGTRFPCLPVKHWQYGLIYPLAGETVATASELMLAIRAGAEIKVWTSVELPTVDGDDGLPELFFKEHLKEVLGKRAEYKAQKSDATAQVYEKLLKEFANSFYGKFAQSINPKNVYRPATGEMVPLGPSTITEPSVASLTTGLARAALSAALLAIEDYNDSKPHRERIDVVSATTDGLLMGLPAKPGYSVTEDYYDMTGEAPKFVEPPLSEVLEDFSLSALQKCFDSYLPLRQMSHSRKELTGNSTSLEIKAMVDNVVAIKTRGQIGLIDTPEKHAPILARFGHKPPLSEILTDPEEYKLVMEHKNPTVRNTYDAQWILGQLDRMDNGRDAIDTYTFFTLNTFRRMIESDGTLDMTRKESKRRINCDFDWKRKLVKEGAGVSPFSMPHRDIAEMLQHRSRMEGIRRTGKVARPLAVLHRVEVIERTLNARGGEPMVLARLFLRGLVQKKIESASKKRTSNIHKADLMNEVWQKGGFTKTHSKTWTNTDLENAAEGRGQWEPGVIIENQPLAELLTLLCHAFEVDRAHASALIFVGEIHEELRVSLITQVALALLKAHQLGIEPFKTIYLEGRLPGRRKILEAFSPHVTAQMLSILEKKPFTPGERHSSEREKLKRLFYRVGITGKEGERCAKIIAPGKAETKKPPRNLGRKRCMEHFVMAILQPDVAQCELKPLWIIDKLKWYGLTRRRYYGLRGAKFTPHALRDSPENRSQIRRMALSLKLTPEPIVDVLLDG